MHRKGAVILPVLIVAVIISLSLAIGLFYLYQKEYAQNIKLQGQITELENRQRLTASQLEESKKIATELELKIQEAKSRIDSLSGDLAAEKAAHAETSNRLEQLKADLSQQKSLREDLETRMNQVEKDKNTMKERIKIINQDKIALEEKIKNLETGAANVELGKVVVNPEELPSANNVLQTQPRMVAAQIGLPQPAAPKVTPKAQLLAVQGLEGKVMIVNKEFNFVVINLGSKDKVSAGDEFLVSRAARTIGELKVEKVHEFMSAAGFAPELKDLIQENDKVTPKLR